MSGNMLDTIAAKRMRAGRPQAPAAAAGKAQPEREWHAFPWAKLKAALEGYLRTKDRSLGRAAFTLYVYPAGVCIEVERPPAPPAPPVDFSAEAKASEFIKNAGFGNVRCPMCRCPPETFALRSRAAAAGEDVINVGFTCRHGHGFGGTRRPPKLSHRDAPLDRSGNPNTEASDG